MGWGGTSKNPDWATSGVAPESESGRAESLGAPESGAPESRDGGDTPPKSLTGGTSEGREIVPSALHATKRRMRLMAEPPRPPSATERARIHVLIVHGWSSRGETVTKSGAQSRPASTGLARARGQLMRDRASATSSSWLRASDAPGEVMQFATA